MPRVLTRDTELGGVPLAKGETIMLRFGAANRDERQFPDPDVIDLERKHAGAHFAFGSGTHHCPGAPLSRQELNRGVLALLDRVEVNTGGREISSSGPRTEWDEEHWVVSFKVSVPRNSDLALDTKNGGISIDGVSGRIRFETTNGGVAIDELAGDVRGRTTNGGISVRLSGDTWQGAGLDVETTNGGVTMRIPDGYSARLETGTVNGGLSIDFPITVQGRIDRRITTDLGAGGPTIRAKTTNGGVTIRKS